MKVPKFEKGDMVMDKKNKMVGKVKAVGSGDGGYAFCVRFNGEKINRYYYDNGRGLTLV